MKEDETPVIMDAILKEASKQIALKEKAKALRICSLGCGNGNLDKSVLDEIMSKHPDVIIEYVGVEISEFVCNEAKKLLRFPSSRVKVKLYQQDLVLGIPEDPFDLVLALHCFFFIDSSLKAVMLLKNVMTSTGMYTM